MYAIQIFTLSLLLMIALQLPNLKSSLNVAMVLNSNIPKLLGVLSTTKARRFALKPIIHSSVLLVSLCGVKFLIPDALLF